MTILRTETRDDGEIVDVAEVHVGRLDGPGELFEAIMQSTYGDKRVAVGFLLATLAHATFTMANDENEAADIFDQMGRSLNRTLVKHYQEKTKAS